MSVADVVVDMGAGHLTVLSGTRQRGVSLHFDTAPGNDAIAQTVVDTIASTAEADAIWRLTMMSAGGARVHTAELLAAILRAAATPPVRVLIAGPEVFDDFPHSVRAAETT